MTGTTVALPSRTRQRTWLMAWQRSPRSARAGVILLALLVLLAVLGPIIIATDPLTTNTPAALRPPSATSWFGTDEFGRDIFARVVAAARLDLTVAFAVVAVAAPVGTMLGLVAGAAEGILSSTIMRIADVVLSFPAIILALVIVSVLGNGTGVVVAALSFAYMPYFVRITRSRVISERTKDYVDAAVAAGNPWWRVVFQHLSRNSLGPSAAQAMLAFGWAILDTAGLAFLGVGIVRPTPEWGLMIGEATSDILSGVWWTSIFPGVFVALTVLSASLIGSAVRERT